MNHQTGNQGTGNRLQSWQRKSAPAGFLPGGIEKEQLVKEFDYHEANQRQARRRELLDQDGLPTKEVTDRDRDQNQSWDQHQSQQIVVR